MENLADGFGKSIRDREDTWTMRHNHVFACVLPGIMVSLLLAVSCASGGIFVFVLMVDLVPMEILLMLGAQGVP